MSFNRWTVKQTGSSIRWNTLSNRNYWYIQQSGWITRELWWVKKPIPKGYKLHDFTYITFLKWQQSTSGELRRDSQELVSIDRKVAVAVWVQHKGSCDGTSVYLNCGDYHMNLHVWCSCLEWNTHMHTHTCLCRHADTQTWKLVKLVNFK